MEKSMQNWETDDGVTFLKNIGLKTDQVVLDFGANVGHYSIPAAILVGNNGYVYAIEKDQEPLNKLTEKAKSLGLENIKIIKNSDVTKLGLVKNSIDVVLLYDVLHYFKKEEREILYSQMHQFLKADARLSVYPKHVVEDYPLMEFHNVHLEEVKQEIIDAGFLFDQKYCNEMSHDNELNSGCVLNFKKTNQINH